MLYPIITESRQLIDLSGIWKFKLNEGNGLTEELSKTPLEDTIEMAVPSSYNDLVESQGKEPREVARNYLKEINLLKE